VSICIIKTREFELVSMHTLGDAGAARADDPPSYPIKGRFIFSESGRRSGTLAAVFRFNNNPRFSRIIHTAAIFSYSSTFGHILTSSEAAAPINSRAFPSVQRTIDSTDRSIDPRIVAGDTHLKQKETSRLFDRRREITSQSKIVKMGESGRFGFPLPAGREGGTRHCSRAGLLRG